MKKLILLLLLVILVSGCVGSQTTANIEPHIQPTLLKISDTLLTESDMPNNYQLSNTKPLTKADIENTTVDKYGFIAGYEVNFIKIDTSGHNIKSSTLTQRTYILPPENVTKPITESDESSHSLPDPHIGDVSMATKITIGTLGDMYFIYFSKHNVYEVFIWLPGDLEVDYEELKQIVEIASNKIVNEVQLE